MHPGESVERHAPVPGASRCAHIEPMERLSGWKGAQVLTGAPLIGLATLALQSECTQSHGVSTAQDDSAAGLRI